MKTARMLVILVLALGLASVSLAAADTWTQKADMPTARGEGCSAAVVNGKIYVIGGEEVHNDPTPFAVVEVYDPATDTWERKTDMPTARAYLATAVVDGKIYAIGGTRDGNQLSTVEVYDPATDTWEKKANMPTARGWISASAVNGKIYVPGGNGRSSMDEYDPARDTWTRKASMPTATYAFSTSMVNGKIYVLGGATSAGEVSTVLEYDPATDKWTQKASMPTIRAALSTPVVDGKIYAIGGGAAGPGGPGLPTVEVYDPATDTWEKKTDMPTARHACAFGMVDGKIYVIGGKSRALSFSTVEEYEPALPPPDFNGDFKIDIEDLIILIEHWGQDEPSVDIAPPPSGDGIVDVQDLEVFMSYWGQEFDDPRLVAYWKLDETEGDIAYDSVSVYDGLLNGVPTWQPASGQIDGALQFDGIDDYVSTPFVLNPADGPFSVFAWIKEGAPGQVILSQIGGANWLCTDPADGRLMTELKTLGRVVGPPLWSQTAITDGNWHRVGFVWDGSDRILYADGVEVATDTQTGLGSSAGGLYIGAGKNLEPGSFFSGLIDDVRIYDRAIIP